jgi:hypothetical protein
MTTLLIIFKLYVFTVILAIIAGKISNNVAHHYDKIDIPVCFIPGVNIIVFAVCALMAAQAYTSMFVDWLSDLSIFTKINKWFRGE